MKIKKESNQRTDLGISETATRMETNLVKHSACSVSSAHTDT
uniref:Uncharacterized protein n=1 Tax=Anguilla anguilla TaxID=7936 RepID=A0A0E9UCN4_ANGAN